MNPDLKKLIRGPIKVSLLIVGIIVLSIMLSSLTGDKPQELSYSEMLNKVASDQITHVLTVGNNVLLRYKNSPIPENEFPNRYDAKSIASSIDQFRKDLNAIYSAKLNKPADSISISEYNFVLNTQPPPQPAWWIELIPIFITIILFAVLWMFIMRQQGGGNKNVMNFGKSKSRLTDPSKNKITFADVAGCDEEKEELSEMVEFLKSPQRFTALGARIPKGVLLVGPPGTGKTLLAKAVAGEAGVPYFIISGSDFVEMFVGVGASRVRDMFDQAKKNAPCILFIDEIDAVGRQRGAGLGGGHDEREQTLNQLLVEMDGFAPNEGVIVLAATNRSDILDPALMRPGRFDRQITVGYPDVVGREAILRIHAKGKPLAPEVDLSVIAKRTPMFTGADLSNVLNEAALLTARANETLITMDKIEEAITRVSVGPEKKSRKVTQKDRELVAYHEAGHAVVTYFIPGSDPVHEVSVIPRGSAGGYTMSLPTEEVNYVTKSMLNGQIAILMGGNCAEQLVLGDVSTGATSDIKRATQIARSMVTVYGMSESIGKMFLGGDHEVFLGRDFSQSRSVSEDYASIIDAETRKFLDAAHSRAYEILSENIEKLHKVAKRLVEVEKIDGEQFKALMQE